MRDLDELLSPEISRLAAGAADPPEFVSVLARGQRERRRRQAWLAAAGALATITVLVATQLVGDAMDRTGPAPADSIDGVHAGMMDFAFDPSDPQVRAAVWCPEEMVDVIPCGEDRWVAAVTDDGFKTRTLVPGVGSEIAYAGAGWFVVETADTESPDFSAVLLNARGESHDLTLGDPEPVRSGELVYTAWGGDLGGDLRAVDPTARRVHPIELPGGVVMDSAIRYSDPERAESGIVDLFEESGAFWWAEYGGPGPDPDVGADDWQSRPVRAGSGDAVLSLIPDTSLSHGGAVAEYRHERLVVAVHEMGVDQGEFRRKALPDLFGRVLASLSEGRVLAHPVGDPLDGRLVTSDGGPWQELPLGEPFTDLVTDLGTFWWDPMATGPALRDSFAGALFGRLDGTVYWSADLGRTWTEFRLR